MTTTALTAVHEREMTPMEAHAAFIEEKRAEIIRTYIPRDFQNDPAVVEMFFDLCKARGLNPFARQIYCVPRGKKASIEPSIDGLRLIASRSRVFAGMDEYEYDDEGGKQPKWARCTVYRLVDGVRCAFTARVLWAEFGASSAAAQYDNQFKSRPYHMHGIRAEAHALRKAFPEETSGLYAHEEMETDSNRGERFVDADGVIHEAATMRLPLDLSADQWAKLHAKATARGVDFDPRMTPEQLAGAIKRAGGPRITGKINAGALWGALDHVPGHDADATEPTPEVAHIKAIQREQPVPISDDAPIRDDEIVVEG